MRRLLACACLLLTAASVAPRAGAGLEVEVKSLRAPSTEVVATLELRDVLPERFRKTIDEGGVLHLRVQTEVWEARPVWDRLVYPAIVRVFRFTRGANNSLSITDPDGSVASAVQIPRAIPIDVSVGDPSRIAATERYYVHAIATIGTLAEREVDDAGDAVFGKPSETNALGSLGRLVFRTALQISDYLQSISADAKSRKIAGTAILTRP